MCGFGVTLSTSGEMKKDKREEASREVEALVASIILLAQ
jgi:hypothetical protein